MKTKVQVTRGTICQLNGKWSWKVYVFEPKKDFATCIVAPAFMKEFESENECIENMNKACKSLGIKHK